MILFEVTSLGLQSRLERMCPFDRQPESRCASLPTVHHPCQLDFFLVDVWQLGAVVFYALTGYHPFNTCGVP